MAGQSQIENMRKDKKKKERRFLPQVATLTVAEPEGKRRCSKLLSSKPVIGQEWVPMGGKKNRKPIHSEPKKSKWRRKKTIM